MMGHACPNAGGSCEAHEPESLEIAEEVVESLPGIRFAIYSIAFSQDGCVEVENNLICLKSDLSGREVGTKGPTS